LIFLSHLIDGKFHAGHESIAVSLFEEHEIPWDEMAFPVIRKVLHQYFKDVSKERFNFHIGDITPGINFRSHLQKS
jgi:hypothetical protein